MKILKYGLASHRHQTLMLPQGAEILTVQLQKEQLQLWAVVDETSPLEPRQIARYYTGMSELPLEPGRHIATVQSEGGTHVDHFFEVTPNV